MAKTREKTKGKTKTTVTSEIEVNKSANMKTASNINEDQIPSKKNAVKRKSSDQIKENKVVSKTLREKKKRIESPVHAENSGEANEVQFEDDEQLFTMEVHQVDDSFAANFSETDASKNDESDEEREISFRDDSHYKGSPSEECSECEDDERPQEMENDQS